jgi:DHA2 family methylenomycin A resistance protein-like MFS transporter
VFTASGKRVHHGGMLILTLAIGFVMAMIDVTAVNTALGSISADLHVPLTGLVWVVDGYTLTFAALLLAGGALADRIGPRQAYQSGLALFLVASVLCAIAPTGAALVGARLLQGAGAALFMPSSLSLLTHTFDDAQQRARMVAIWSGLVGVAATIGPLVGGLLVQGFGWRAVFWINVPVGLLGIILAQWRVPAPAATPRPLSLLSHVLGVGALSCLSFVLIEGQARGWTSAAVLLAAVAALALGAVLVLRERRGAHPMLPRALFASPSFSAAVVTGFLINFGVFGQLFLYSLFLQQAQGRDALHTGLLLLPMMASSTLTNLLSGRVIARYGTRGPLLGGLVVAAAVGAVLAMSARADTPYALLLAGAMAIFLAIGISIPAMTNTVIQASGREHANSAAAALNANRQVGALVGVAVMGAILHATDTWSTRLPIAFASIALCYAAAALLISRRIPLPIGKTLGSDPAN